MSAAEAPAPDGRFFEAVASELEGVSFLSDVELARRFPGMEEAVAGWLLSKGWMRRNAGEVTAAGCTRRAWLYCSPRAPLRGFGGILRRERAELRRLQAELAGSNERHPVNIACRRMVLARMAAARGLAEGGRPCRLSKMRQKGIIK